MSTIPTELPQSDALSEASPDSLAELSNRDPEGLSDQDFSRVIAGLREMRTRIEAAAKAQAQMPRRSPGQRAIPIMATPASAEELDL